jgi:hypothetical protein
MRKQRGGFGNGSIYMDVLLTVCFMLLLILPLFAYASEKYIMLNSLQIAADAIEASCLSAYNAIDVPAASQKLLFVDKNIMDVLMRNRLHDNLKLEDDMTPLAGSIAAGEVVIESAELLLNGFPATCSGGTLIRMPSFHIMVRIPLMPGLFRKFILNQHAPVYMRIHRDYEIPIQ